MAVDAAWIQERIDATKAQIVALEDALLALAAEGGIQSYTFDSAQSRQVASRYSVAEINAQLDKLASRLDVYCSRLNGSGNLTVVPGW